MLILEILFMLLLLLILIMLLLLFLPLFIVLLLLLLFIILLLLLLFIMLLFMGVVEPWAGFCFRFGFTLCAWGLVPPLCNPLPLFFRCITFSRTSRAFRQLSGSSDSWERIRFFDMEGFLVECCLALMLSSWLTDLL